MKIIQPLNSKTLCRRNRSRICRLTSMARYWCQFQRSKITGNSYGNIIIKSYSYRSSWNWVIFLCNFSEGYHSSMATISLKTLKFAYNCILTVFTVQFLWFSSDFTSLISATTLTLSNFMGWKLWSMIRLKSILLQIAIIPS